MAVLPHIQTLAFTSCLSFILIELISCLIQFLHHFEYMPDAQRGS